MMIMAIDVAKKGSKDISTICLIRIEKGVVKLLHASCIGDRTIEEAEKDLLDTYETKGLTIVRNY